MRISALLFGMFLTFGLLGSPTAQAQVVVRGNVAIGPPPRTYYGPRPRYYPPRPAVGYAVPPPRPVIVVPAPVCAPAPYYVAPPVYYAPRPRYGYRGRGYHGRRW